MDVIISDDIFHPIILILGLYRDGVHAELAAVVPRALPVPLGVLPRRQPGEVVGLAKPLGVNPPCIATFSHHLI